MSLINDLKKKVLDAGGASVLNQVSADTLKKEASANVPGLLPNMSTSAKRRADILDAAKEYTCKDRNASYGEVEGNFQNIANLWNSYLASKPEDRFMISSVDVALMMSLVKTARLATNPNHLDSWVDLAGYAACGGGIVKGLQPVSSETAMDTKDKDAN